MRIRMTESRTGERHLEAGVVYGDLDDAFAQQLVDQGFAKLAGGRVRKSGEAVASDTATTEAGEPEAAAAVVDDTTTTAAPDAADPPAPTE